MSKFHRWLHKEIDLWIQDGLLQSNQAEVLRQRYALDNRNWSRFVLSALGGLLVGLGVILIFAYNWEDMHRFVKLTIIFGFLAGAHGAALWFRQRGGPAFTVESLHALGTMLFGAGIVLVAQIYHIDDHFPNAFLLWAAGAMLMAWVLPSLTQTILATALLLIWQLMEVNATSAPVHWAPGLLLLMLPLVWRLRSIELAAVATPALVLSIAFNSANGDNLVLSCLLTASAAVALGRLLPLPSPLQLKEAAAGFALPGLLVCLALLYPFTFAEFLDTLSYGINAVEATYMAVTGLTALALWAAVLFVSRHEWRTHVADLTLLTATALAFAVSLSAGLGMGSGKWTVAAVFNLLILLYAVLLIVEGNRSLRKKLVVGGSLLLCLLAAARYVDLFDSLISRGLVFLAVGGGLFAVAHFYSRSEKAGAEER